MVSRISHMAFVGKMDALEGSQFATCRGRTSYGTAESGIALPGGANRATEGQDHLPSRPSRALQEALQAGGPAVGEAEESSETTGQVPCKIVARRRCARIRSGGFARTCRRADVGGFASGGSARASRHRPANF